MTSNTRSLITVAAALTLLANVADNANACCGANTAYYAPQTSYFAPAYTTGYAPAYTSYYSGGYAASYAPAAQTTYYSGGWYPGYWADRVRVRMWGTPTTYVTGFAPSTCSTCQQTNFVAGFAPVSSCSTCSASPCSTCASYAPASSCGCSTCESGGCSSCSAGPVAQASYQPQSSCGCDNASYTAPTTVTAPAATSPTPYTPPATTPATNDPRPGLDNPLQPTPQNTTTNRPVENTTEPATSTPAAPATNSPRPEYDPKNTGNSTYNEAPKLFDPQDRTAQRNIAPVHNALYKQPASYRQVSTARTVITAEQAQKDAVGWSSVSK